VKIDNKCVSFQENATSTEHDKLIKKIPPPGGFPNDDDCFYYFQK